MPTINISSETADQLMKDILVQDYLGLVKSVEDLSARALREELKPHQLEDLANDRTFRDAMAVMLTYYLSHSEYSKILSNIPEVG